MIDQTTRGGSGVSEGDVIIHQSAAGHAPVLIRRSGPFSRLIPYRLIRFERQRRTRGITAGLDVLEAGVSDRKSRCVSAGDRYYETQRATTTEDSL